MLRMYYNREVGMIFRFDVVLIFQFVEIQVRHWKGKCISISLIVFSFTLVFGVNVRLACTSTMLIVTFHIVLLPLAKWSPVTFQVALYADQGLKVSPAVKRLDTLSSHPFPPHNIHTVCQLPNYSLAIGTNQTLAVRFDCIQASIQDTIFRGKIYPNPLPYTHSDSFHHWINYKCVFMLNKMSEIFHTFLM